jgi:hypothetical protein
MSSERINGIDPRAFPQVAFADTLGISEFGENRVAAPGNRFDIEFIYDKQPLLADEINAGAGTVTHQANSRDLLLSVVGVDPADVAGIRGYAVPYTPGSGQEIDITGTLDAAAIGGGHAEVFLRTNVTGTVEEQAEIQGTWSALTSGVNWNNSQIFRISFQSLKVGRIQYSLVRSGLPVKVAEITNDNLRISGYWQTASLPPTWRIYQNAAGDTVSEFAYGDEHNAVGFRYVFDGAKATATAVAICATVKSQGGDRLFDIPGFPFSVTNSAAPLGTVTVSTTLIPVISFRVAATFNALTNRALYIPTSYTVRTNNPIFYQWVYRPVLTDASWQPVDTIPYSGLEYDVSASAFTGGYVVASDFISTSNNTRTDESGLLGRTIMTLGYTGTANILSLVAIRDGSNNATVSGILNGRIIR